MRMNLLLQSRPLINIVVILMLWPVITLTPGQAAKADAAPPPDPTVGGLVPYQPQETNVQMLSEIVYIDVPPSPSDMREPKQIKVDASFTMRNQGQVEEQMQVIFPLTRLNTGSTEEALYQVDPSSFVVEVNGRPVPFTTITTPPEIQLADMEHGFVPDVQWAAFDVTFSVQKDVLLQVEYEMLNPYGEYGQGFTGIAYILETGAGWYGNILSAKITLRLPYMITEEAVSANPGYVISGNEMHWTLKDIEPTREDNLEINTINADVWQSILNLRARVEKYPEDADAWSELGDQYMKQAGYIREGYFIAANSHFTELTMEARQKVVALRPDWGDAHYKLAEILWLSNLSVQNKLRMGGQSTAPEPSLDDPTIQDALHEIQLAWSLGSTSTLPYLNKVFPELVLTVDAIATVTISPPAATLAPLGTSTVSSTIPLTLSSAVFPTPARAKDSALIDDYAFLILGVGLLITGAVFVYKLKSKSRSTK